MEQQTTPQPQLCMKRKNLENLPEIILPEGYTLRTYVEGDGAHWVRILDESFGGEHTLEGFHKEMIEHPAFQPDRLFFVCGPDGLPCATAGAYRDRGGFDPTVGYVHYVGVCTGHLGKKLGYWVSLAVLRKFHEEGCASSFLNTDDFRLPAIKTYLNLSFKPILMHQSHRERWIEVYKTLGLNDSEVRELEDFSIKTNS